MTKRRILFVCTGNVCRSLMAELMLNDIAARCGLELEARSCGTGAERFFEVPAAVWGALAPLRIAPRGHLPRLVSPELLAWGDEVLAMTRAHANRVRETFPEHSRKVRVLREAAGLAGSDVEDPIGRPDRVFDLCRDRIREAIEALVEARWT